jgi:hypothetical protein
MASDLVIARPLRLLFSVDSLFSESLVRSTAPCLGPEPQHRAVRLDSSQVPVDLRGRFTRGRPLNLPHASLAVRLATGSLYSLFRLPTSQPWILTRSTSCPPKANPQPPKSARRLGGVEPAPLIVPSQPPASQVHSTSLGSEPSAQYSAPLAPPVASAQFPPPVASAQFPPPVAYAQFPPPVASAHVPPPVASAHVPPPVASVHVPPPVTSAHVPPPVASSQFPPVAPAQYSASLAPPVASAQFPPPVASAQFPPPVASAQYAASRLPSMSRNRPTAVLSDPSMPQSQPTALYAGQIPWNRRSASTVGLHRAARRHTPWSSHTMSSSSSTTLPLHSDFSSVSSLESVSSISSFSSANTTDATRTELMNSFHELYPLLKPFSRLIIFTIISSALWDDNFSWVQLKVEGREYLRPYVREALPSLLNGLMHDRSVHLDDYVSAPVHKLVQSVLRLAHFEMIAIVQKLRQAARCRFLQNKLFKEDRDRLPMLVLNDVSLVYGGRESIANLNRGQATKCTLWSRIFLPRSFMSTSSPLLGKFKISLLILSLQWANSCTLLGGNRGLPLARVSLVPRLYVYVVSFRNTYLYLPDLTGISRRFHREINLALGRGYLYFL